MSFSVISPTYKVCIPYPTYVRLITLPEDVQVTYEFYERNIIGDSIQMEDLLQSVLSHRVSTGTN